MKQIPNLFTLLNLFAGVLAIIFALQTNSILISQNDQFISSFNIPEKLTWAAFFILIAAIIDFLDGFIARLFKATSELGKQLDSLSDVVSFGVAPAVILYQLLRMSYAREEGGIYVSIIVLVPAIILACAAAYRLGKFNISSDQQHSFKGVPVPAVGILVASFPLILHFSTSADVNALIINKWFLYISIIVLSYLMVSNHRMLALKFSGFDLKKNWSIIALVIIAISSAILWQWLAVPITFIFYIVFSLLTPKSNFT